jgi:uncharacterized protein
MDYAPILGDLDQGRQPRPPFEEATIDLLAPTGTLKGTLTLPVGGAGHAVLIIAGSGPTDRDGNSAMLPGKNDCLKLLARGLAAAGVASLRYDKRGVGASARTAERDLRFETYMDDGAAWLRRLEGLGDFGHLSIVGHSEGALVGALVARRVAVDAYVSLEGAGRTASDTLRRQLRAQLPGPLLESVDGVIDQLVTGSVVDPLPDEVAAVPAVAAMFRPSVQPYLVSWFRYDPAVVLADLDIPVLIVQGTRDLQVDDDDAERLAGANPLARRVLVSRMNHVLKEVPDDREANIAAYGRPDLELAASLLPAVVGFLDLDHHPLKEGASSWSV